MSTLSLDQVGAIFTDATAEVFAASTGLDFKVFPCECDIKLDDMVSFLTLFGENNGMLFISASETVSRTLCANMTGAKASEVLVDDINDALCELANMVAGNAKLRFNNAGSVYSLSPLFLIRGKDMSLQSKKRVAIFTKHLTCGDLSILLKVVFF